MKKINDRIMLGIATGLIAAIPGRILNTIEYNVGLTDKKYGQMAANLFIDAKKVNSSEGRMVGAIANGIMTGLTGVMTTYLLSKTGRDKAVIKGMSIGASLWMGIYGLTTRLGITQKSKKPLTPLLSFVDHIIFGSLCGLVASTIGDDCLFPDRNIAKNKSKKIKLRT